jgi:hypothetical protein
MTYLIEEDLDKAGIAGHRSFQGWKSRSTEYLRIAAAVVYTVNRQPCRANIRSKAGYSAWGLVLVVEESSRTKIMGGDGGVDFCVPHVTGDWPRLAGPATHWP